MTEIRGKKLLLYFAIIFLIGCMFVAILALTIRANVGAETVCTETPEQPTGTPKPATNTAKPATNTPKPSKTPQPTFYVTSWAATQAPTDTPSNTNTPRPTSPPQPTITDSPTQTDVFIPTDTFVPPTPTRVPPTETPQPLYSSTPLIESVTPTAQPNASSTPKQESATPTADMKRTPASISAKKPTPTQEVMPQTGFFDLVADPYVLVLSAALFAAIFIMARIIRIARNR